MRPVDFPAPSTRASLAALQLAQAYYSPAMLNHVQRSWLWAEGFAEIEGRGDHDRELVYVAAMLHDIGLAKAFDNATLSYEEAGGHVAVALTTGAGWPAARRQRVLNVIIEHNWDSVDPAFDEEGYLLEAATGLDISGKRASNLPAEFIDDVLSAYPRGTLRSEFGDSVADQSKRKPATSAHRLIVNGLIGHLAHHLLEMWGE